MTARQTRKWVGEYVRRYPGNISVPMVERLNQLTDKELRRDIAENEEIWRLQLIERGIEQSDDTFRVHLELLGQEIEQSITEIDAILGQRRLQLEIPMFGQFLICLFVSRDRQAERLADMDEIFSTIWAPKFGPKVARLIYVLHAFGCAAHLAKNAAFVAIFEKVLGLLRRLSGS